MNLNRTNANLGNSPSMKRLKEALELVLQHKSEIDAELHASIHHTVLGIKKGDSSKENLKKWFLLAFGPGWRAGPLPSLEIVKKAMKSFDEWYDYVVNQVLQDGRGEQETMDEIYRNIKKIHRIGWKIAGVYLKDIIYHFEIWPQFKEYLYIPIDRHVRNVLIHKLRVFEEKEVPKVGESYFTRKNQSFHQILDKIHKPRVEFDYFWCVGAKFCSFHLCDFCWIRDFCISKNL